MATLTYISITHARQPLSASYWGDLKHKPEQKHPNGYAVDWGLHFHCFIIEEVQSYVSLFLIYFWRTAKRSVRMAVQKNENIFVIISGKNELIVQYVLLKNAMEHSRYLCNFMQWKCVNSQKNWVNLQKLQELPKTTVWWIKKKTDSTLFSLGFYLNGVNSLTSYDKQAHYQKVRGRMKFSCFISHCLP